MKLTILDSFELDFNFEYIYIRMRGFEYWKQWRGTDIN